MIYTHLAALVIGAAGAWFVTSDHFEAEIADIKLKQAEQVASAHKTALRTTEIYRDNANEAVKRANARASGNKRDADALRGELDGLRSDLAGVPARIGSATREAVNLYAATATDVFERCAARYSAVADAATGHASDVRTFDEAWPVMPAK
jgi:large exoprotein involved in heme utilization and adhesion